MADLNASVELGAEVSAHQRSARTRRLTWLSFVEAMALAMVAVATAWSGYQASRWNTAGAHDYALYEHFTALSQEKSVLAGQDRLYDIVTFSGWLEARSSGRAAIESFYERRFRHEYATAFAAWLRLDPLHDRSVPASPIFMPQYKDRNALQAQRLASVSTGYLDAAVTSGGRANDYVRATVFLATVLFLTALSQRFDFTGPRMVVMAIAAVFLIMCIFWLLTSPRR